MAERAPAGSRTVLVTGGSGFIGSAVVRRALAATTHAVVNLDKLTYAANPASLADVEDHPRYTFVHGDVCDRDTVRSLFREARPDAVLHLAAESHVDRSIDAPAAFFETNLRGTYVVLEEARRHWLGLDEEARSAFRFVHVSTDEVFGSLGDEGAFDETSRYAPTSPYSASKAGADHLARAWAATYALPVIVTNASNNYGPRQFPEKLIPLATLNAMEGRPVDVYGRGENIRDWVHVDDHARALLAVVEAGEPGATYLVGGFGQKRNLDVVRSVCEMVEALLGPLDGGASRTSLIRFVEDRPGHDYRYAIDSTRIQDELGWRPERTFEEGLRDTVRWYVENEAWWRPLRDGSPGERRGLGVGRAR